MLASTGSPNSFSRVSVVLMRRSSWSTMNAIRMPRIRLATNANPALRIGRGENGAPGATAC